MSITQKSKKKLIKGSVIVVVLLLLFTLSAGWRDARLEKRAQMLPKAVHVSLGKTGSSATTEFLVDSADGLQSFMVSIETLDELTRDQIDPSTRRVQ